MKYITPSVLTTYIKRNWFQLGVVAILAIAFIQNDINVEFSLGDQKEADRNALLSAKEKPENSKATMGFSLPSFATSTNANVTTVNSGNKETISKRKGASYQFIERFKEVAQDEAQQFRLPASVIVGLGLHQANSPKAVLAKKANNFFAIPCTSSWEGSSVTFNDACYRSYDSAWFSFRDNSNFLNELRDRYGNNKKKLSIKAWTRMLEKAGVISDGHAFLKLVRKYKLTQLDN